MDKKQYLLLVLSEEAVEVSHSAHKVLRFTEHDSHTIGGPTNIEKLETEYNDLLATVEALKEECGFVINADPDKIARKRQRIRDYFDYSVKLGVVNAPPY